MPSPVTTITKLRLPQRSSMPLDKQRRELVEAMMTALETPTQDLTKWEEHFLESLAEQLETKHFVSDRQFEILDRIYTQKT